VYYPVHSANPVVSLKNLIVKQEDFPLFQVHQAITVGFLPPNSTKQAHFNRFKLLRSTQNRYLVVILNETFFNGWFLCPGGELFTIIQ